MSTLCLPLPYLITIFTFYLSQITVLYFYLRFNVKSRYSTLSSSFALRHNLRFLFYSFLFVSLILYHLPFSLNVYIAHTFFFTLFHFCLSFSLSNTHNQSLALSQYLNLSRFLSLSLFLPLSLYHCLYVSLILFLSFSRSFSLSHIPYLSFLSLFSL